MVGVFVPGVVATRHGEATGRWWGVQKWEVLLTCGDCSGGLPQECVNCEDGLEIGPLVIGWW